MKKREGVPAPLSLKSFVSCGLSLLIGFPRADTEKSGETIATPPKRGFLPAPIAALCNMPLSRPQGVANRRYLSLREGSEQPPRRGAERRETVAHAQVTTAGPRNLQHRGKDLRHGRQHA